MFTITATTVKTIKAVANNIATQHEQAALGSTGWG